MLFVFISSHGYLFVFGVFAFEAKIICVLKFDVSARIKSLNYSKLLPLTRPDVQLYIQDIFV